MSASEAERQEFRATAGNAGIIGITAFLGAIFGFGLQLLVAYYFGAGSQTDAFFMAQTTSELLSKLLLGGSITAVFIPLFVERITAGRTKDAWSLALNILHLLAGIYVVAIVLLAVFSRPFVQFIAPGFNEATLTLTVHLLRILLPSFFFLFLVEFATSMLQSFKRFALPALLRIVAPTISSITIIALAPRIGISALAIGVVIGSVVQVGILVYGLYKEGFSYSFIFRPSDPVIKQLLLLVYPFIFSVLMTQAAGIVYRVLVSDLSAGSLASLKFAEKITQLLTIIFLNSVTVVIFPTLAEKAARSDMTGFRQTIGSAVRLIVFVSVPIVIGGALLRDPLVAFLFERGSFSSDDAAMTSIALLYLIIGLTTNGISSVFGHAVLAFKKTSVAVIVSVVSQIVAISLFVYLVPLMAHAGLALASSLVPVATAVMYFIYLRRRIPSLESIFYHRTLFKTAVLALGLAAGVLLTRSAVINSVLLVQLFVPTIVGAAIFFGGATIWNVHEMHELIHIVRGRLRIQKRV